MYKGELGRSCTFVVVNDEDARFFCTLWSGSLLKARGAAMSIKTVSSMIDGMSGERQGKREKGRNEAAPMRGGVLAQTN